MSNLEYITQARKLLTEDYKTKHANEYNSWLARHQNSWMQPHTIVPFPPFIVSAALAPFKASASAPTEEAVVAKALELYNQFNPRPVAESAPVLEPAAAEIVEEVIAEPVVVETVSEPVEEVISEPVVVETVSEPVEEVISEPVVVETVSAPITSTDTIHKIFQTPVVDETVSMPVADTMPPSIEAALSVIPQPAEELAKVKNAGRILPSVLQRLRDMAFSRSTIEEKNV